MRDYVHVHGRSLMFSIQMSFDMGQLPHVELKIWEHFQKYWQVDVILSTGARA